MGLPAPVDDNSAPAGELAKYGQPALTVTVAKGHANTLRYAILSFVAEENYDQAIHEFQHFLNQKSDYPKFKPRVDRYVRHGVDLIHAIRAKRHFPGIHSLTITKQQELAKKVKQHLDELQYILRKIEKIQVELRVEDSRSTIWVVRAIAMAILSISLMAFILDFTAGGIYASFYAVADELFGNFVNWLWGVLGL
ncbi:MAG: hypothetical protein AB7H97_11350 [Pseudobdellovibrionaceae bacterium]